MVDTWRADITLDKWTPASKTLGNVWLMTGLCMMAHANKGYAVFKLEFR